MTEARDPTLDAMERELAPLVEPQVHPPLFHYSDAVALLEILKTKQIWATHFAHLNDVEELQSGERLVEDEARRLASDPNVPPFQRAFLDHFSRIHKERGLTKVADVFVASFSAHENHLSQWRAYASNGAGYAVGFNKLRLPEGNPDNAELVLMLVRCEYEEAQFRATLRAPLTRIASAAQRYMETHGTSLDHIEAIGEKATNLLFRHVAPFVPRFKHKAFEGEDEWRLVAIPTRDHERTQIKFRGTPRGIVPYIAVDLADEGQLLSLSRVVVGPTLHPSTATAATKLLLRNLGYDGEQLVTWSAIPFRG